MNASEANASSAPQPRRVLALQPFAGDSHAALIDGWRGHSRHHWTVLELPPVHWKWRMRHGPLTFAAQARQLVAEGSRFDVVFCTDMLPLHEWRGLVGSPLAQLPAVVYFHENQLTYPTSDGSPPDLHYGYTNLLTLLAAESAWFNSDYHRQEFQRAALAMLARMPDHRHVELVRRAFERAEICPPGIDRLPAAAPSLPAAAPSPAAGGVAPGAETRPLHIGWIGRWEHDKRPDRFAEAIDRMAAQQHHFRLVLLGQRFRTAPPALRQISDRHASRIVFNGYATSRQDYWTWLSEIDVVVSTADHEFFGIAAAEAIASGALPLVPDGLAYPELLGRGRHPELEDCFYDGTVEGLAERLSRWLAEGVPGRPSRSLRDYLRRRMEDLDWARLAPQYDQRIDQVACRPDQPCD